MSILWDLNLDKSVDYYYNLPAETIIYIKDLKHKAPTFIKKCQAEGVLLYGPTSYKRGSNVLCYQSYGVVNPDTKYLKLIKKDNSKVYIYDFSAFVAKANDFDYEMMGEVIQEMEQYGYFQSPRDLIHSLLKKPAKGIPASVKSIDLDSHRYLCEAMKGGANCVLKPNIEIPIETHVDYHQIYAYAMKTNKFPLPPQVRVEGYEEHELAIYVLAPETYARVKKTGYPLLPSCTSSGMAGADGEWFDAGLDLHSLSDPDYKIFLENYETAEPVEIVETIYWNNSFDGSKIFGPLVDHFYERRQSSKSVAIKNFYKQLNEVLPGYFETAIYMGSSWLKNFQPNKDGRRKRRYYNPCVGIFITAYGRTMLNELIHLFPHNKVIGYDTDCVFFEGTWNQRPKAVKEMSGPNPGQVHEDCLLRDVVHYASKWYEGFDYRTNEPYFRRSGYSKTGFTWRWDRKEKEYFLQEMNRNEEPR